MNKSEIAERAAREIHNRFAGGCVPEKCDLVIDIQAIVERAIAESQAPQPKRDEYFCSECGGRLTPNIQEGGWAHFEGKNPCRLRGEFGTYLSKSAELELGDGEPSPAPPNKPRVFLDMDGVVVDFESYKNALSLTGEEVKKRPGAYLNMKPYPEAIKAIKWLVGAGYDVWLATKPATGIAFAYADKADWVFRNLPELRRKLIITHDKGFLGDACDFLVDDRPHKANCERFKGTLIPFINGATWENVLAKIRSGAAQEVSPKLLSAEQIAQKLANVGGIERWRVILQEWLDSYIAIWKQEEILWRTMVAEGDTRELKAAANKLVDYCIAHDWGMMPEPYDSINPLLKLLGRFTERTGSLE